jgi:hypothetical protein
MKTPLIYPSFEKELDFPERLQQVIEEFGSRYALSKASGIAVSTLQAYEAGSKPGLDALVTLARTGNLSIEWLLTGKGKIRASGMVSGNSYADVVMVDQYKYGAAINTELIIGQIPFSRYFLERKLQLDAPRHRSLLAIESEQNLGGIRRGDLVLIDRTQTALRDDGMYLLNVPGMVLKGVSVFPNGWVVVTGPQIEFEDQRSLKVIPISLKMRRRELLGDGKLIASKVIGRAVLVSRPMHGLG